MPAQRPMDATDLVKQVSEFGKRLERRRFERKKLLWAATVEVRGQRFEGIIVDFSAGGARIKFDAPVAAGEELTLILKQFEALGAKVIWQREGEAGLQFLLAPDEVAARVRDRLELHLTGAEPTRPPQPATPSAARSSAPGAQSSRLRSLDGRTVVDEPTRP